jgi:hypothetical protein
MLVALLCVSVLVDAAAHRRKSKRRAGRKSRHIQAPRGQEIQAPRGQELQAPRADGRPKAGSKNAYKLVKEAEDACAKGDMATAKAKAQAALAEMKK